MEKEKVGEETEKEWGKEGDGDAALLKNEERQEIRGEQQRRRGKMGKNKKKGGEKTAEERERIEEKRAEKPEKV